MNEEEIAILKRTIRASHLERKVHHTWIKAFELYNQNHEKQLSMSCPPCYFKVIAFCIKQNKMEVAHGTETTKTK